MADDDKLKTALVNANDLDRNDLIIKSMADNPLVKEEYKGMLKNISTNPVSYTHLTLPTTPYV